MTDFKEKNIRATFNPIFIWLADLIVIWISVCCLQFYFGNNPWGVSSRIVLIIATVAYIPACLYIKQGRHLTSAVTLDKVFINSIKAIIIHALVFMSLAAFLHLDYSITFYVLFYGILFIAFPLINIITNKLIKNARSKGYYQTRVAIVGVNPTSQRLSEAMLKDAGYGYKIIGYFDIKDRGVENINLLGNLDDLEEYARQRRVDEIFFTSMDKEVENMARVVKIAENNVITFYYVPKISRYVSGGFDLHNIGSIPVLTLRRNPLSVPWRRGVKRIFDIAFSSVVLLFSPIIFIPIAIGIKLSSPGPIFFKQERTGYKGQSFKCYKFRTMRVNASADKDQASRNDPRKTRFGNFLRRTSLDELPQFINVWKGDMTVVGPRPHMLKHTEDYMRLIDKYMVRHKVKPGITGWAQVNGFRGQTDELWKMEKRVECDVWYIENWTFSLDLKIIFRTVMNAIRGESNAF